MRSRRLVPLLLVFSLMVLGNVQAQDNSVFVRGVASDMDNFNTVTQTIATSAWAQGLIFPPLMLTNPETGLPESGAGLTSWELSDDGLTYTFTIREGATWTDGTPITSADVDFTFNAILSDSVETHRKSNLAQVSEIRVIDDHTIEVEFARADCNALENINIWIMPAHKFAADYSDFTTNPFNDSPDISGGPYIFAEHVADEYIRFTANPDYWAGTPQIDEFVFRIIPDPVIMTQALSIGDVHYAQISSTDAEVLEGNDEVVIHRLPSNAFLMMGFNHADPANPQPAYDENKNVLEQGAHPIFGDVRVRQAIIMGWNHDDAITLSGGTGKRLASTIPSAVSWAYNPDLEPYPYDPEAAATLLDEAGWVMNETTGVREKDGMPLEFQLDYATGRFDDIAALIADQLAQIGVRVKLNGSELGAIVSERVFPQVHDAWLIAPAWSTPNPQVLTQALLHSSQDTLVGTLNTASYNNPELDALLAQATTVPGCDVGERAAIYYAIQDIIHRDAVYDFIYEDARTVVTSAKLQNFIPYTWGENSILEWSLAD